MDKMEGRCNGYCTACRAMFRQEFRRQLLGRDASPCELRAPPLVRAQDKTLTCNLRGISANRVC